MIFQEPMTSLNPVFRIGDQIGEVLELHRGLSREAARRAAVELLGRVRIADAPRRAEQYPHELSGGMKQRVMIAMALACDPALLIADEPTTALDVTIQAQILDLLRALQRELGMAILLITHDLGVVAQFAERVAVMYAGERRGGGAGPRAVPRPAAPLHARAAARAAAAGAARPAGRDRGQRALAARAARGLRLLRRAAARRCRAARRSRRRAVSVGGRPVRCWLHAGEAG